MDDNSEMGINAAHGSHALNAAINRFGGETGMKVAAAAVIYAECGVPVFPCDPKRKSPLVRRGFKDATTNVDQVRRWWSKWPDAMIGVPTGLASKLFVLDVDDLDAFNNGCSIERPETLTAITGKGEHYYFAWDPGRPVKNAQKMMRDGKARWPFPDAPGCDCRGEGGYIIVAPSRHPNGRIYTWKNNCPVASASDALYACLAGAKSAEATPLRQKVEKLPAVKSAPIEAEKILLAACQDVRNASMGEQEATLNSACFKMGALIANGDIPYAEVLGRLVEAASQMPSFDLDHPWRPEELGKKVNSAITAGIKKAKRRPRRANKPSEDACAIEFVQKHGSSYRYVSDIKAWMIWSGQYWTIDLKKRVVDDMRVLVREKSGGDPASCRFAFISGALKIAASDPNIAVAKTDLDRDGFLLGTPNGTVDLRTGELRQARPDDLITMTTATGPANGQPTKWLKFIDEVTEGDHDLARYLQMLFGYCLTGSTREQSLFFVHGVGENGKSVFSSVLLHVMGTYAVTAATHTFMASKSPRHTTDLAALAGHRLVTASETSEHNAWDESLIKQITGGEQITARFMRQDNFSFTPAFKLLVTGNYPPTLDNVDPATRRRLKIIPFNFKPSYSDKSLIDKLKKESGQILSWAIDGCVMWQRDGFSMSTSVKDATDEFFSTQDPFQDWLDQKCKSTSRNKYTSSLELWMSWQEYAKTVGENPKSQKAMATKLRAKGYELHRTSNSRGYLGIELRKSSNSEDDQDPE
ncbi:MAG: phage/plasmid primase, P4 family [Pseudomonadota bacterium]